VHEGENFAVALDPVMREKLQRLIQHIVIVAVAFSYVTEGDGCRSCQ
jgi:hypothetical protein